VLAARGTNPFQESDRKQVLQSLAERAARFMESWDAAAQACLAADALGHTETDLTVRELGRLLAFPSSTDSPARFRSTVDLDEQLKNAIRRAGQAALQKPKP
jgi:hypothetical protein